MKKLLIVAIVAMIGGMVFISCDEDAGTKVYSYIDGAGAGTCMEITTSNPQVQEFYDAYDDIYIKDACPSANAIGTCTTNQSLSGLTWQIDIIYYSSNFTENSASTDCSGTWNAN